MEESLRETEIDMVKKLDEALLDNSVGTNPLFDHIEQCESLKKYCQKQMKQEAEEEVKVAEKVTEQEKKSNDIDKALSKGSIQKAATKEEKNAEGNKYQNLVGKGKGKKNAKKNQGGDSADGQLNFAIVKKFNSLKLTVPMKEEDYTKTMDELDQLKDALVYWGKIIQRQSKIKYIKSARKISSDEHFVEEAQKEEKFIEQEKAKYSSEDTAQHELNADKLKIAQVIDRESRLAKVWDEGDDEDHEDKDSDDVFGGSDEDKPKKRQAEKQKGGRQTQRPNKAKFAEIMKSQDAFPTLENNNIYEDDEEEVSDAEEHKEGETQN